MPVRVPKPYGECSVCQMSARVWQIESADVLLCGICLRLLVDMSLEDLSQPS